ncbi:MAG TPA: hypothetical protein VK525_17375 [Candidatus Saccharimonadales bacterium]|jgi:peptidyl-prolyl cis-trans isomerase SurA|nr:hypothetical protein [Candidatus Saccharimonadales bacterium]
MRGRTACAGLALWLALCAGAAQAQEVIDRIVARLENDVLLESDLQELERYQKFVDDKSESETVLLDRLIDQWIVRTEADAARFPQPSASDVQRGIDRLVRSLGTQEEFEARKKKYGLSDADLRKMITAQTFLSNYLDSRFRPSVQVDSKAVQEFYEKNVIARAKARGQTPPTLDEAQDFIHELLVQRGINEQADRWLQESRAHLHVKTFLSGAEK